MGESSRVVGSYRRIVEDIGLDLDIQNKCVLLHYNPYALRSDLAHYYLYDVHSEITEIYFYRSTSIAHALKCTCMTTSTANYCTIVHKCNSSLKRKNAITCLS